MSYRSLATIADPPSILGLKEWIAACRAYIESPVWIHEWRTRSGELKRSVVTHDDGRVTGTIPIGMAYENARVLRGDFTGNRATALPRPRCAYCGRARVDAATCPGCGAPA